MIRAWKIVILWSCDTASATQPNMHTMNRCGVYLIVATQYRNTVLARFVDVTANAKDDSVYEYLMFSNKAIA